MIRLGLRLVLSGPTAGTAPLRWHPSGDTFDGQPISRFDVAATGASSPVPPGIPATRHPAGTTHPPRSPRSRATPPPTNSPAATPPSRTRSREKRLGQPLCDAPPHTAGRVVRKSMRPAK
jgi:hypothetical protein